MHYESEEGARLAIERVDGTQFGDTVVSVVEFLRRSGKDTMCDEESFTNLYVKHFPNDWDENKVEELFVPFGCITSVTLRNDSLQCKFTFINFEDS